MIQECHHEWYGDSEECESKIKSLYSSEKYMLKARSPPPSTNNSIEHSAKMGHKVKIYSVPNPSSQGKQTHSPSLQE